MTATTAPASTPAKPAAPAPQGNPRYHTDFVFTDRATRAKYTALKYAPILQGGVLDVGCDQRSLREHLPRPDLYLGVDLAPPADVCINLDRENLPFDSASFDTVVCTDVLEHLERIHAVFDELLRVAKHKVIVSLPAPLSSLLGDLAPCHDSIPCHDAASEQRRAPAITPPRTGPGSTAWKKFYGLPIDPPLDRHRWFFGFEDAKRLFEHRSQRLGWRIEQLDCQWEGCGDWRHADGTPVKWTDNEKRGGPWCVLEPVR